MADRKLVQQGFTDIYGITWDDIQIEQYNKIQQEIIDREEVDFPVSDQLLNDSHIVYNLPKYTKEMQCSGH